MITHFSLCFNIGLGNGLAPIWRQAITSSNAVLSIGPSRTNFSETSIKIHQFSLKKMHLKRLSAKCRPFCSGLIRLNVFNHRKQCGCRYHTVCPDNWLLIHQGQVYCCLLDGRQPHSGVIDRSGGEGDNWNYFKDDL